MTPLLCPHPLSYFTIKAGALREGDNLRGAYLSMRILQNNTLKKILQYSHRKQHAHTYTPTPAVHLPPHPTPKILDDDRVQKSSHGRRAFNLRSATG